MKNIFEEADKLRNQGKSLEAAKQYLEVANTSQSDYEKAAAFHMAGVSFSQSGTESTNAESCFNNAVKYYEGFKDPLNLARVFRDQGILKLNTDELASARDFLEKSIDALKALESLGELAMSQAKLAVVFARLRMPEEATSQSVEAVYNANKSENVFYIATAYQEAARVEYLNHNFVTMLAPLYSALGALKLESDPHAKRHAELFQGLAYAYDKTGNQALSKRAGELSEKYLAELDDETAARIHNYFKQD